MIVLLTGATGYLGQRAARRLVARGHRVLALVRDPSKLPADLFSRVELLVGDLARPLPSELLRGRDIDVLVHAAALIDKSAKAADLDQVNHLGTVNVVSAALEAGTGRVILISSLEAAGPRTPDEGECFEEAAPAPDGAYGASKLASEMAAARLAGAVGVPFVALRPGNIFGDGVPGVATLLVETLRTEVAADIHREWWNHRFQPVHVEDVLDALESSLSTGSGIYNVAGTRCPALGELLLDLQSVAHARGVAIPSVEPPLLGEAEPRAIHYRYRSDRAHRDLGYCPAYDFRAGLLELVSDLGLAPTGKPVPKPTMLRTLLMSTPSAAMRLNRDMGGGLGFVHENADRFPPLGLLWLAASLRERGWPVTVVDGAITPFLLGHLLYHVNTTGIDCVVGEVNLPTFEEDLTFLRDLKTFGRCRVVARTALTDVHFHERLLREARVDFVLTGECDLTIDRVLLDEDHGGTVRLVDDRVVTFPEDKLDELDRLPLPARDLLDPTPYRYGLLPGGSFTTVQSSRGCPYSCGYYCPYPLTQGKSWRARSAAHVIDELADCAARGLTNILFRDATFTLSRKRTLEICQGIIDRGLDLTWWCETRINCLDDEVLDLMAKAGCTGINFGLESGDDEILARSAKAGVNVQKVRHILARTREAGIHSHLLVVVGLPDETRETIAKTYDLVSELPAESIGVTGITPFPGTELWEDAVAHDWVLSKDWSRYGGNDTVMKTDHLSDEDIRFAGRMIFEYFNLTRPEAETPHLEVERHRDRMSDWVEKGLTPA